jgi:signal transduction histidine kinase
MSLDIANITPWKWDIESRSMTYEDNKPIETYLDGTEKEETKDESIILTEDQYFSLIHEDDRERVRQAFLDLLQGKIDRAKEEYRIRFTPESPNFDWVEAQAVVEKRDKEGNPLSVVGSSLTITERKRIEEELLRAKEKAEESNRLKSAFLANMSHEIRTPLNAIVGFSNILATTEKEEEKMEYINIIENNNTLLLQLVSDILDLSKLEAGTMEVNYTDVDLNKVMQDQVEHVQEKAAPGVQVILEQQPDECHVKIEKIRLLQVLTNLLMNAAKFTAKGEIRFGYSVQDDKMLRFYVSDTGKGIARDQVDKIFGRFVKLDTFKQGTGLGLSLCQAIVDHFGGEIGVDSEEAKGSTFWFTFPYAKSAVKPAKEIVDTVGEKQKPVILIAEDIPSNFELFELILKHDYEIVHAWDGKEAVDLFKEKNPLLILMDINMPKLNGYEATMEIRKLSRDVPIIAVTAYAFSTDENQIKKNGFSAYTPKPLDAQSLKNQISELLEYTN